jgi:hypothetical protein
VLGIKYNKQEIFDETTILLHYNCPAEDCSVACRGWPDLHHHVKSVHHRVLCDLCTRNKKVFTHEHELFTYPELRKHEKFGDDNPGAQDQTGFKGHPECGFCKKRFYGDDELFAHCRDQHERCFLCDRRNEGRRPQYFLNYDSLAEHFAKDHHPCLEEECLEKKFVVFDAGVDLKAHQLEAHSEGWSKNEKISARRVDMTNFQDIRSTDYRQPVGGDRGRGGTRGRGGDRGRGGHTRNRSGEEEEPTTRTQLPMSRAEQAYHRTLAVQSAQSVAPRTFGGQLTQPTPTSTSDTSAARPARMDFATDYPSLNSLSLNARSTNSNSGSTTNTAAAAGANISSAAVLPEPDPSSMSAQERARYFRHAALNERVSSLLNSDQHKLSIFRAKVSAYKASSITAPALIDTFWSLFDTSAVELGKLVRALAELYEIADKREALLKAWNDWRAINEDYPALPGSASNSIGGNGGLSDLPTYLERIGGSRVLKLKSSTKQSEKSQVNRQTSWGRETALSNPSYPALSSSSSANSKSASRKEPGPGRSNPSTWTRPSFADSSQDSSSNFMSAPMTQPSTAASKTKQTLPRTTTGEFPALPPAKKPETTIFGYGTGAVRRDFQIGKTTGTNTIPWGWGATSSGTASAGADSAATTDGEDDGSGSKKKKKGGGNKGKKQILFHVG